MAIVPSVIVTFASACMPSSPEAAVKLPPVIPNEVFVCTASSAEFIVNVPPFIVIAPSAFMPLQEVSLVPSEDLLSLSQRIPKPLSVCAEALAVPPFVTKMNVPPSVITSPEASIASEPLVIVRLPPPTYTNAFDASSEFSACMPSVPLVIVRLPSAIRTLSLQSMPFFAAVMLYVPQVIFRSSLQTMPCAVSQLTVSVPVPLSVRSDFENTAPSVLLSVGNSPVEASVPPAAVVVTNTLSALFTYSAASPAQVTDAPSSTICTFASSASTTIRPFAIVPESLYVPASVIVRTPFCALAPLPFTVMPLSESVTVVHSSPHSVS